VPRRGDLRRGRRARLVTRVHRSERGVLSTRALSEAHRRGRAARIFSIQRVTQKTGAGLNDWPCTKLTLAVHPRDGEEIFVVGRWGADAVCAEFSDGIVRQVPIEWTSLRPKRPPLFRGEQPVLLALGGVRELARFVAARQKVGPASVLVGKGARDEQQPDAKRADGSSSVVEQADATRVRRQAATAKGHKRGRR